MIDTTLQRVRKYQEEVKTEARRYGRVQDMFGRVRLVPEVISVHQAIREAGLRQAVNAPIQMAEVGVIKTAMIRIWDIIQGELGHDAIKPLLQIYDSLLFEVEEGSGEWIGILFRAIMEKAVKLSVPLIAKMSVGNNWGQMETVK